jgi:hypothetical protein
LDPSDPNPKPDANLGSPRFSVALSILACAWQGALLGCIVAPLLWAGIAIVTQPPFHTDETYWWASLVGAALGGLAGVGRGSFLAGREPQTGAFGRIVGGLVGVLAVVALGIPCSGLGGAAVGILIWAIQAEFGKRRQ